MAMYYKIIITADLQIMMYILMKVEEKQKSYHKWM
jgi:hypothetical protein